MGLFRIAADGCKEGEARTDCGVTGATSNGTDASVEDTAASDSPSEIRFGTPAGWTSRYASVVDTNGTLGAFGSNGNAICGGGAAVSAGNDGFGGVETILAFCSTIVPVLLSWINEFDGDVDAKLITGPGEGRGPFVVIGKTEGPANGTPAGGYGAAGYGATGKAVDGK